MSKAKRSFIVAIDTQTLIWAVRKEGSADELKRAKWLFEQLDIENAQGISTTAQKLRFYLKMEGSHDDS